jgi:hypothetical protein
MIASVSRRASAAASPTRGVRRAVVVGEGATPIAETVSPPPLSGDGVCWKHWSPRGPGRGVTSRGDGPQGSSESCWRCR